jgi:hypothetical protein
VTTALSRLAERIRLEMADLELTVDRAATGVIRAKHYQDDIYLDAIALNLHTFYTGMERLFEKIAVVVDGQLPQGANWHKVLLMQMGRDVPDLRPAVISEEIFVFLDEYRGFRHVVRNIYTYKFDPVRIETLAHNAKHLFEQLKREMLAFADFLDFLVNQSSSKCR